MKSPDYKVYLYEKQILEQEAMFKKHSYEKEILEQEAMFKKHSYEKQILEQEAMFKKQLLEQEAMFKKQMREQESKLEAQRTFMHEKDVRLETVERQLVTSKQMHLIDTFKQGINEARGLKERRIANLREYLYLKEKRDDWFDWLSNEQTVRLNQLKDVYVDLGETLDVNAAMDIVTWDCEKMVGYFSSQVKVLEDALVETDIGKMKQSQEDVKKQHVDAPSFFQTQTEHIKSNIRSSSRAVQTRGKLQKVAVLFYNIFATVYNILVS